MNERIAEKPPWDDYRSHPMTNTSSFAALQSLMISEPDDDDERKEPEKLTSRDETIKQRLRKSSQAYLARSHPLSRKRSAPLIEMKGSIEGYPSRILVDCGASCNYVSQRMVNRYQLKRQKFHPPLIIELADGSQTEASEELMQHRVMMSGFNGTVDLVVTRLKQYDVILGIPWFKRYQPVIDWRQGLIVQVVDDEDVIDQKEEPRILRNSATVVMLLVLTKVVKMVSMVITQGSRVRADYPEDDGHSNGHMINAPKFAFFEGLENNERRAR